MLYFGLICWRVFDIVLSRLFSLCKLIPLCGLRLGLLFHWSTWYWIELGGITIFVCGLRNVLYICELVSSGIRWLSISPWCCRYWVFIDWPLMLLVSVFIYRPLMLSVSGICLLWWCFSDIKFVGLVHVYYCNVFFWKSYCPVFYPCNWNNVASGCWLRICASSSVADSKVKVSRGSFFHVWTGYHPFGSNWVAWRQFFLF